VLAARALALTGDTRAREVLERLLEDHPDHPELRRALEALEE
jgi:HEAT repeat protein